MAPHEEINRLRKGQFWTQLGVAVTILLLGFVIRELGSDHDARITNAASISVIQGQITGLQSDFKEVSTSITNLKEIVQYKPLLYVNDTTYKWLNSITVK